MPSNSAEYQRAYRAKQKLADVIHETALVQTGVVAMSDLIRAEDRIRELEAEVKRLKVELAARPAIAAGRVFSSRPFTPVPKKMARG